MKKWLFATTVSVAAIFSLSSFSVILFFTNPADTGRTVKTLFFATLFLSFSAVAMLGELVFRRTAEFVPKKIFLRGVSAGAIAIAGLLLIRML